MSFVYIPARVDKSSARWKSLKELNEQYGIKITQITFEAVQEPVTNVIETLLPWIGGLESKELLFFDVSQSHSRGENGYIPGVAVYNLLGRL